MTEQAQVAPARGGFFIAMLCDENGIPDEANVMFFGSGVVIAVGAFINTFTHYHFPFGEFCTAMCALTPLYKAARGDWRAPQPTPPKVQAAISSTAP